MPPTSRSSRLPACSTTSEDRHWCSSASWWPPPRWWSAWASWLRSSGAAAASPPTTSTSCGADRPPHGLPGLERTVLHAAYLMPVLPLGGFVVLALAGRRLGDPWAGWLGTLTVAGSFVVACIVYAGLLQRPSGDRSFVQTFFTWIPVGGLQVKAGVLIDHLSMTMALFVTGISTLIHLYSVGYMRDDPDYPKFFVYMNLFVASMLILVLADNLVFTFVGWEGVGLCSYWLVAFWFERDTAASAG